MNSCTYIFLATLINTFNIKFLLFFNYNITIITKKILKHQNLVLSQVLLQTYESTLQKLVFLHVIEGHHRKLAV